MWPYNDDETQWLDQAANGNDPLAKIEPLSWEEVQEFERRGRQLRAEETRRLLVGLGGALWRGFASLGGSLQRAVDSILEWTAQVGRPAS